MPGHETLAQDPKTAAQIREEIRARLRARQTRGQGPRDEIREALRSREPFPVAPPIVVTGEFRPGEAPEAPARAPLEPEAFQPDFTGLPVLPAAGPPFERPPEDLSQLTPEQAINIARTLNPFGRRAISDEEREAAGQIFQPAERPLTAARDVLPLDPVIEEEARPGTVREAPISSLEEATAGVLRSRQRGLAEQGFLRRAAGAAATGVVELGETLLLPPARAVRGFFQSGGGIPGAAAGLTDPSRPAREFLEEPARGRGTVLPGDEGRNFAATFGIGLAEFIPELAFLAQTGAFALARAGSAPARKAIVGALENTFGKTASTRIFSEALRESAEFGLTIGTFEAAIGRGIGEDAEGKVRVFGQEFLAGVAAGTFFGGGRQFIKELIKVRGPIADALRIEADIADAAGQGAQFRPDLALARVAERLGMTSEDALTALGKESTPLATAIRKLRKGAGEIGTMREIRAERAVELEAAAQEVRLAPVREFAGLLRDQGTLREGAAMAAVRQRFPRLSMEEIVQVVSETYGVQRAPVEAVDVGGRPTAAEPARGEVRADLSRQMAEIEVTATRLENRLERPDVDREQVLQEVADAQVRADRLVDEAGGAGENALVDRAARQSAKLRDLFENPPEVVPVAEPPKPKAAEPKKKPKKAEPKPPPEPERPPPPTDVERVAAVEEALRADLERIEAKETPSRRESARRGFIKEELERIARERGVTEPAEAKPEPEPPPEPKPEPVPEPERPAQEALPAAERLDQQQRADFEEIFPEARNLTDEELAAELAAQGIEPKFAAEEAAGRRISDLTNEQLVTRIESAGLELPDAVLRQRGETFRESLLEIVDPGRRVRETELRQRVAEEIRGRRRAERAADTDALTGVANRRALDAVLPKGDTEIPGTEVAVFDGNFFGQVNKKVSQQAGDDAIVQMSEALTAALEELGLPVRLFRRGGDEFVVLAPEGRMVEVIALAESKFGERTFGEVKTTITGNAGKSFDAADAGLQAAKTARKGEPAAPPEPGKPAPELPPPAEGERTGLKYEEVPEKLEPLEDFGEQGAPDVVLVERPDGSTQRVVVRYAIVEAGELVPSHIIEGRKSRRNPAFVDELQARETIDPEFIAKRASDADFDEGLLVLKTPTPERGPPIVDEFGITLGGNNRLLILKRVYEAAGEAAERLRAKIRADAEKFGIDPKFIEDMENPILVRVLENRPKTVKEARALADDLNRTAIQARTPIEEAVLASERLSDATAKFFETSFPDEGTVRAYLRTQEGREFLRRLESDAVISAEQRKGFFDKDGNLNDQGRDFIENIMLARAMGSAAAIERMPASVRRSLLKAAPTIGSIEGPFNVRPALQQAVRIMERAEEAKQSVRDVVGQQDLFGEAEFSPFAAQLAEFLTRAKTQKEVVEAFRSFREAARQGAAEAEGQGAVVPARGPREAFEASFGTEFLKGFDKAALDFAKAPETARRPTTLDAIEGEPTLPAREPRKPRFQATEEQQAKLREKFGERTPEQRAEAQRGFEQRRLARQRRREERARGETERAPVQRPGAGGDRPDIPTGPGKPSPGESGGRGTDPGSGRDIDPTDEPGVARGERKREREKKLTEERAAERKRLLEEEDAKLREALVDVDDVTDIKRVRDEIRVDVRGAAERADIDSRLVNEQLKDIARIQSNLLDVELPKETTTPRPGFLVGNAPGTGKTFIGMATVKETVLRIREATGRDARILVVIPGKKDGLLVQQWKKVAADVFGLEMKLFDEGVGPGIWHMSAAGLSNARKGFDWGRFDLAVFDEAHLYSNLAGAARAIRAKQVRGLTDRILHLSATPFEFPWDFAYLENLRLWGKGRKYADFDQWLAAHGIRKTKNGRQWYFTKSNRQDILRTLIQIRREMIELGIYTQREMKMDKQLRNEFVEVPMDPVMGAYYQDVMSTISALELRARGVERNLLKSMRVTFTRRISELAKIPEAISLAKKFLKEGRSVVIFSEYKADFQIAERTAIRFPELVRVVDGLDENMRMGLRRIVREMGGEDKVAQIHGLRTQKQRNADLGSAESGTGFLGGEKRVLVATGPAGGTGLSLHDTLGKFPRAQINLTAPWTGKSAEQLAGRTYRVGSKSDVVMVWLGIDTAIERSLLQRVAMKMSALGALVQGKIRVDAQKLAEFDFLPIAELEADLFGYKTEIGAPKGQKTLDSIGRKQRPREPASMLDLDELRMKFNADLAESTHLAGLEIRGRSQTSEQVGEEFELPRHPRDIPKPAQIIGGAARRLLVRAFHRKFRKVAKAGEFKIVAEVIGLRSFQDVGVAAHEMGHFIDKHSFGFLEHPAELNPELPSHLRPFAEELRPMAYDGAKNDLTEGVAEFFNFYVMDPARAKREAPRFFDYMRDHLNRTDPQMLNTLDWMQEQVRVLAEYGTNTEQILSRMAIGDDGKLFGKLLLGRTWLKFYSNYVNYQAPLRVMDQMMMGKQGNDWLSLEQLGRATMGADPIAENMMFRGIWDFKSLQTGNLKRVSKGMPEIFKGIDNQRVMNVFRAWTVARRGRELSKRGFETGLEDLAERGILEGMEREIGESNLAPVFEKAWKDLEKMQDAMLKWLVDSGVIDAKAAATMKLLNRFFVPFQRVMGEPDQLMDWVSSVKKGQGGVDGLVALPPAIFRFKGSTRMIVDPIESIVGNIRYFTQLGLRKRVENQIAKFADDVFGAEGGGQFIERIPAPIVASKFTVAQVKQALKDIGIELPSELSDEQLREILTIFHPMNRRKDAPIFNSVVGGKRRWYQINDPLVWNAIAGMSPVEFGLLAKLAILHKTTLRTGVVSSPAFMIRNFIRDAQTAWIQTPARGKGARAAARTIPMVAAIEGLAETIKAGKLWDEFVASGAAGAALNQISRPSNQIYMRKMLGSKGLSRRLSANHGLLDNTREAYKYIMDQGNAAYYGVTHVGSLFENANRVVTFKAAREQGVSPLGAGFAAREVSTDFAVHGARMAAWRLMTAFANPAVQGLARTGRAFKQNPLRTMVRSSSLTAFSAMVWWLNQQDPDYPEYNTEVKSRYWIWRNPQSGRIYRVPKAYVYGDVFGSFLAEAFLDWASGQDPDLVNRLGVVIRQGMTFTVIPNFILTPFEIALNKSLHFGTDIEPQGIRSQYPPERRANEFTSETSQALSVGIFRVGEAMELAGSGRAGERGGLLGRAGRMVKRLNFSPMQYDHIVRGYFGTMGSDIWQDLPGVIRGGRNLVRRITGDEPIPRPSERIRRRYFVRDFTLEFPTSSAKSLRRFYDIRNTLNDIALRYEFLKHTDPDEALEYYGNHADEINAAPLFQMAASKLAVLTSRRRQTETRDEWAGVQREALELVQDFLGVWGDLTPAQQKLLGQRSEERAFEKEAGEPVRRAREDIEIIVMRRQLKGLSDPPRDEIEQVTQIIRGLTIKGRQRRELIRFYRRISVGDIVDREFGKTSRATRLRFQRQR